MASHAREDGVNLLWGSLRREVDLHVQVDRRLDRTGNPGGNAG